VCTGDYWYLYELMIICVAEVLTGSHAVGVAETDSSAVCQDVMLRRRS
jgi:hypothetical protein